MMLSGLPCVSLGGGLLLDSPGPPTKHRNYRNSEFRALFWGKTQKPALWRAVVWQTAWTSGGTVRDGRLAEPVIASLWATSLMAWRKGIEVVTIEGYCEFRVVFP